MTATGKILKSKLREQYWHHLHPATTSLSPT